MSTLLVFVAMIIIVICDDHSFQMIENHNHQNMSYKTVGDWSSWFTGYHVNDRHDGYLNIGNITFNAANIYLNYSVHTNCTNTYLLFANGRIYCTSDDMLYSYYPQNGSISFSYKFIGPTINRNPTFTINENNTYVTIYAYDRNKKIYLTSVDAITGVFEGEAVIPTINEVYFSPYITGTQYGEIYFTNRNDSYPFSSSLFLWSFDSKTMQFSSSTRLIEYGEAIPTLCDDKVIIQDRTEIIAFTSAPDIHLEWKSKMCCSSRARRLLPICFQTANGYRIAIEKSFYECISLDVVNGEMINILPCNSPPIFHYDIDSGYADVAIVQTTETDQIVAIKLEADGNWKQQLWYNDGNAEMGFIVSNWFITGFDQNSGKRYILYIKIYNVYNGDIVFEESFIKGTRDRYSIVGSLYDNNGTDEFMLIVRVEDTIYAFTEWEDSL